MDSDTKPVPQSFDAFWPSYLAAHADPRTRLLHVAGTLAALGFILVAAFTKNTVWLLAALVASYGAAWTAHFARRLLPICGGGNHAQHKAYHDLALASLVGLFCRPPAALIFQEPSYGLRDVRIATIFSTVLLSSTGEIDIYDVARTRLPEHDRDLVPTLVNPLFLDFLDWHEPTSKGCVDQVVA